MVIRNCPHGAAMFRVLAKRDQRGHQDSGNYRRGNVQLVDKEAIEIIAAKRSREILNRTRTALGQAKRNGFDVRSPHQVAHTLKEVGKTDGGHEQDDGFLTDQMPEQEFLNTPGKSDH